MNQRMKRGASLLMAGILAVGLVPSAFAAQDGQTTPTLEKIAAIPPATPTRRGAWPRS